MWLCGGGAGARAALLLLAFAWTSLALVVPARLGAGVGASSGTRVSTPRSFSAGLARRAPAALWMSLDKGPGGAKNDKGPPKRKAPKDDVVQVEGKVVESLPNAMFRVEIQPSKQIVLATISGKIRKNFVRVVVGDSVVCELSAYDLTRGRITYRSK